MVVNHPEVTAYQNADKSIRVVRRKQSTPIQGPISKKDLRQIAEARLKSLELLQPELHDFKIDKVSAKRVQLGQNLQAYEWSGSYKDKKGKVHFFKEFIASGYTWNVFSDKKKDLRSAHQIISGLIKI